MHGEAALAAVDAQWIRFETPMKPATNGVAGRSYSSRGVGDLLDDAVVHDRDAVGHRERLLLVVRDVDERRLRLRLDVLQLELHLLAELQVEGAERLVEQQRRGPVDERAGERDALLLAAGELARLALLEALEAHRPDRLRDALLRLGAGRPS